MCDFMKNFTTPLNETLAGVPSDASPETVVKISDQAKSDLWVWAGFLADKSWLPIQAPAEPPSHFRKEVVTDAAGLPDRHCWKEGTGCGGVALYEDGTIYSLCIPTRLGERFSRGERPEGSKVRQCLEALGLLLPILSLPEYFKNSTVVTKVDCLGVVFGMWNKHSAGDKSASVIIRAVHLIVFLECNIVVDHLPHKSDWDSEVADRLTRSSSMNSNDHCLVGSCPPLRLPRCLWRWFRNPSADWSLASDLLLAVMKSS